MSETTENMKFHASIHFSFPPCSCSPYPTFPFSVTEYLAYFSFSSERERIFFFVSWESHKFSVRGEPWTFSLRSIEVYENVAMATVNAYLLLFSPLPFFGWKGRNKTLSSHWRLLVSVVLVPFSLSLSVLLWGLSPNTQFYFSPPRQTVPRWIKEGSSSCLRAGGKEKKFDFGKLKKKQCYVCTFADLDQFY